METNLNDLLKVQKIALNFGDMATLNAVNQKIFEIREQQRKQRKKEKQKQIDNETHKKIENILIK